MKQVKAFIKPHKLDAVALALHRVHGVTGLSVSDIKGFGRGRGHQSPKQSEEEIAGFIDHIKIELVCLDAFVEQVVEAIETSAHTGLRGDGKIYVSPIETAVRISTGERGEKAV